MSDFVTYSPIVPERISELVVELRSDLLEDRDGDGLPLGTFSEVERIVVSATVVAADGSFIKNHRTANPQVLISNGIMTAQQLTTLQTWLQSVRDGAETVLLPAP